MADIRGYTGHFPLGNYATYDKSADNVSLDGCKYASKLSNVKFKGVTPITAAMVIAMDEYFQANVEIAGVNIDDFCGILNNLPRFELAFGGQPAFPDIFFTLLEDATSWQTRLLKAVHSVVTVLYTYFQPSSLNVGLIDNVSAPMQISIRSMPSMQITTQNQTDPNKTKLVKLVQRIWFIIHPLSFLVILCTISWMKSCLELESFSHWGLFPCIFSFIVGYLNRAILKPDPFYDSFTKKPASTLQSSRDLQFHLITILIFLAILFCSVSGPYLQYYIVYYIGLSVLVTSTARVVKDKTPDEIRKMNLKDFRKYSSENFGANHKSF